MKFDFAIGNPPYQDEQIGNGRKPPIYNKFMDEAYKIADVVELITPGRFLFGAGQTPKAWNAKMLHDKHLKVIHYETDATKVFTNTEIKGGVAITIHNTKNDYGQIRIFTIYKELNDIIKKVFKKTAENRFLNSIISSRGNYRTTDKFLAEFPYAPARLGRGTGNMIASNFFEKIPEAYCVQKPSDCENYVGILSRINGKRTICYINKKYVQSNSFLNGYNLASPKSNGNGVFGETLTAMEVLRPREGATDTFISIGSFKTKNEVNNLQKYIKTKFLRALLGVTKVTQDNSKNAWRMIPLQNLTNESDIDWSKSVADIDKQLYKKYKLSKEEINFIETHVKEMA